MLVTNPRLQYPASAEAYWLQQAQELTLLNDAEALERLTPSVAQLSDLFTTERPAKNFPDYFSDSHQLVAYGLFFLPQSFVRTGFALSHAIDFRKWKPPGKTLRILDLGSGPGSCGTSVAHQLQTYHSATTDLTFVDRSPTALAAAENFAHAVLKKDTPVSSRIGDASRPETWPSGPYDIIVAGFVLNEMSRLGPQELLDWMQSMSDALAPGGLILILEPALKITSERLQRLSDAVVAHKIIPRIGPDLDDAPCPQLAAGVHWSHEVRAWSIPIATEIINRQLHRDLREIRFSFSSFSTQALPPIPTQAIRIVSDIQIIKGLVRFIGISNGALQTVEVSTRGLSKHDIKARAAMLERGDTVAHTLPPASKVRLPDFDSLQVIWSGQRTASN